jgi:hypothetical protein
MIAWPRWVRHGWWILGAVALLGSAALRVGMEGRAELLASDTAWSAGDAAAATVHARRAASAFVPAAAHVARAYRRLREIAAQSEARGDPEAALFAWRAIRAAAIGSRSWLTSHDVERAQADAAISRISPGVRAASLPARQTPAAETSRAYLALMSVDAAPSLAWGALFLAGAGLWVVGGVRLARRGFDAEGRLQAREARTAAVLAVAGLAAWFAGLLLR